MTLVSRYPLVLKIGLGAGEFHKHQECDSNKDGTECVVEVNTIPQSYLSNACVRVLILVGTNETRRRGRR